ncbi:MAG: ThuA domain-containing protein [Planctomycetaceae bacterium]|nr:ThuA domain-containing protein [Planctomycetaceae bacterium]
MRLFSLLSLLLLTSQVQAQDSLKILFLGDNGHHRPVERFHEIEPALAQKGIDLRYTDNVADLNLETLNKFDGLMVYANIDTIEKAAADAILEYVDSGKAFIPLHCATYCFRNDDRIVALMGAQFSKHGGEEFTTEIWEPEHPIMRGYGNFTSWDETYVHTKHNPENRTVLEYRTKGEQAEGKTREPWTWTRTHGRGRVFYTAWGHDSRTFTNPGFVNLLERGIRWACNDDPQKAGAIADPNAFPVPQMTSLPEGPEPFKYVDVGPKIPNYTPGTRWGVQGAPKTTMQLPLSAEESMKRYVVPQGFELKLFATEPQLGAKPISMNWDERGRLWVCETVDYPNALQPENKGHDRIEVVEDTDGDGVGDKFTLFADNLSIPTAIVPFDNGCIVQNGTETLWLADTNSDGKADVREIIITGWALGDTHGGVSNFRLGLDNWVYGMQGYNDSKPVINGKAQQSFRMGFFRFRIEKTGSKVSVTELEFLRSTNNNTWGLGISEEGLIFGSTANHCPSVYMPIANRYYERVRGWSPEVLQMISDTHLFNPITEKVRQVDQFGGYTAGAGHALYTGRNYPEEWWNRLAFVCGPTGHLVGTFVLNKNGSDYSSTSPFNLVAADDEWAAPIMAEVGPDGNVWVLDWYNYIVQHNPTPQGFETGRGNAYESDLRDKRHGRIYRVIHSGNDRAIENLGDASGEELVAALKSPTMLVRLNAQRALIERGNTDVVPQLIALLQDDSVDAAGLNAGAIHALWTLDGLKQLEDAKVRAAVTEALGHPSAGVRRNAAQVLAKVEGSVQVLVSSATDDDDAQVRLAALLAIADQKADIGVGQALARIADQPAIISDRWLRDAFTSAVSVHSTGFLMQLAESKNVSDQTLNTVRIVAEHIARGKPSAADVQPVLTSLAKAEPSVTAAYLAGLNKGWPQTHSLKMSDELEGSIISLLKELPASSKGELIRLAGLWGSKSIEKYIGEIVDALMESIEDEDTDVAERVAAAKQLVGMQPQNDDVVTDLLDLIGPNSPLELSAGLISSLSNSRADSLGEEVVSRLRTLTPNAKSSALTMLLSRPETTAAFLDGTEEGMASLSDLSLDQKRALSEHPVRNIRDRARKMLASGGGLPNADRQKVVEELHHLTEEKGNVEAGLAMFKKHCMKCHRHGDIGENIGPNLTGMAVHPKEELLVHIMDPSRSVEGNFRLYTVMTADGRIISGMLASETRTSLELIDTEAKRHPIQRSDIEELVSSPKSLMPEGFEKQMKTEELRDLLEFLTNKGKYVPLDLRKIASVVTTKPMFHEGPDGPDQLIFDDWKPKVFAGVPFLIIDPKGSEVPNMLMLRGRNGTEPPKMPTEAEVPVNAPAKIIHMLGGVGGWSFPALGDRTSSLRVRLFYADGTQEDHELINGVHMADYIRRVDVPQSEFAFAARDQQVRYLKIEPKRPNEVITKIAFIKPDPNDIVAPIVTAVTVETP